MDFTEGEFAARVGGSCNGVPGPNEPGMGWKASRQTTKTCFWRIKADSSSNGSPTSGRDTVSHM